MLHCLQISLLSIGNHRPLRCSSARQLLRPSYAVRRRSTTIAPSPEKQKLDQNKAVDESAMEFLTTLGIDSASALALLQNVPLPLTAANLEALSFALVSIANVPSGKLPELFLNADSEFFSLPPETISANYKAICSAWPTEKQLRRSIIAYPAILTSSFPAELQKCMTSLRDMGFTTVQTAAAVVRCPELTKLRRYEITTSLALCGINGRIEDEEMLEMLSKNPKLLTPEGSKNLSLILEAVKKVTGVTAQQAQHIVARCPKKIFELEKKRIRKFAEVLLEFGLTQAQVGQAALLYPPLICKNIDKIQHTLGILLSYNVTPTQVATYPQVFIHNPDRILAPRLAFLKKTAPEKIITLSLATLFSSTDAAFSSAFSKSPSKTYLKYKIKSLVMSQFGNALISVDDEGENGLSEKDDQEILDRDSTEDSSSKDKEPVIPLLSSSDSKTKSEDSVSKTSTQKKANSTVPGSKEGQKKDEVVDQKSSTTSIEKRKQQQQQQQQQRRVFVRRSSASSAPQKKKINQQQQQMKRLTPDQLEKSKEKKK